MAPTPTPEPEPMPERIARLRRHADARQATARAMGLETTQLCIVVHLDVLAALFAELDALREQVMVYQSDPAYDRQRALGQEQVRAEVERLRAELDAARRELDTACRYNAALAEQCAAQSGLLTLSGADPRYLEYLRQQREQGPPPGPPQP